MKRSYPVFVVLASLAVLAAGCGGKKTAAPEAQAPAAATAEGAGTVIARFNGESITDEDVRKVLGAQLVQAEMGLYDARKGGIDQIVEDRLLTAEAQAKGVSKDDFLKTELYDKIKIEDKEIEKFYSENKDRMQGKPLEEVKGNIRGFLFREAYQAKYDDLLKGLKKKAKIEVLITAPKLEIDVAGAPAIGPEDAPIRLVEFTDFQCPFCGRARPAINQVLEEYKGKVHYVLRDFPLSFHKDAMKAHEAFHCAGDQGKIWEMNKKLWDNQQAIGVEDLKKYASELKLDSKKFEECLDSGKFQDEIQKSLTIGQNVGVSGTPAFFINGRMISGARPFEAFKEIIEDELKN